MSKYAVIETGSKQYRVSEGETIVIEKLKGIQAGATVEFDRVLAVGGESLKLGQPYLKEVKVAAEIVESDRGPKLLGFKYKRKTRRRRKFGHRQSYMKAVIKEIRG
ncbi:50S ribosomal protein L21 [Candidatus Acetothermia bacterium]|nr:50S ribosomal protein L21 [Candidatus Acetothermia bacterium]